MTSPTRRPLIIYHSPCPDGFTAAWAAWKFYKGEADFHPAAYKTPPPDVTGREVTILDFCYPEVEMREMIAKASSVLVVDHHMDKYPILLRLAGEGRSPDRFSYVFDDKHSGAYLAWQHLFCGTSVPPLVLYVEDRDLWRNDGNGALDYSRPINAVISLAPYLFPEYDWLNTAIVRWLKEPARYDQIVTQGNTILLHQEAIIDDILKNAYEGTFGGESVRMVNCNCSKLVSQVAAQLAEGRSFGLAWFYRGWDNRIQVSLRSTRASGYDVKSLAKLHGGGGHYHAAGFEIEVGDNPLFGLFATNHKQETQS